MIAFFKFIDSATGSIPKTKCLSIALKKTQSSRSIKSVFKRVLVAEEGLEPPTRGARDHRLQDVNLVLAKFRTQTFLRDFS